MAKEKEDVLAACNTVPILIGAVYNEEDLTPEMYGKPALQRLGLKRKPAPVLHPRPQDRKRAMRCKQPGAGHGAQPHVGARVENPNEGPAEEPTEKPTEKPVQEPTEQTRAEPRWIGPVSIIMRCSKESVTASDHGAGEHTHARPSPQNPRRKMHLYDFGT